MSVAIVQALLNRWARLTRCGCRDKAYLDHRSRKLHIRNNVA